MSRLRIDEEAFDVYYPGDGSDTDRLQQAVIDLPEEELVSLIPEMKEIPRHRITYVTDAFSSRNISASTVWKLVDAYFGTTDTRTVPFACITEEGMLWLQGFLKSKHAPVELMLYCYGHKYTPLEWFALSHPQTPIELVNEAIFKDASNFRHAASHPKLPRFHFEKCVQDLDHRVRQAAALNPSAQPEDLLLLSQDDDFVVRLMVTENPSIPASLLFESLNDPDNIIAENAKGKILRAEKDVFVSWFPEEHQETIRTLPRDWAIKMVTDGIIKLDHTNESSIK